MPHVIQTEVRCIDHTSKIDIITQLRWFLELAIIAERLHQVIRTPADASIAEDVVDSGMLLFSKLEKSEEVWPGGCVGLLEAEVGMFG